MKKQIIVSPTGERMVVLPEADYEALARAAASAGVEMEPPPRGRAVRLPPHLRVQIAEGDNPIRVWREFRGLSVRQLADRVKMLDEDLSELETGQREPTVEVLKALAKALGVVIEELI